MKCVACTERGLALGVLCQPCSDRLVTDTPVDPEQIIGSTGPPTDAWLIDCWGRAHVVEGRTLVGRGCDFSVYVPGISRKHALLERGAGGWTVADLGSRNGTYVNGNRVAAAAPVGSGDVVQFGGVPLLFHEGKLAERLLRMTALQTAPLFVPSAPAATLGETGTLPAHPNPAPKGPSLVLVEPTRGGGGVLLVGDQSLELSLLQYALLVLLQQRLEEEADLSAQVRGYVPTGELVTSLPWSTSNPTGEHLKQLIRRTRQLLATTPVTLESSRHFGYRLVISPPLPDGSRHDDASPD